MFLYVKIRDQWERELLAIEVDVEQAYPKTVTSHIAWEWGCAYMYKCTLYDTTRFKAVMVMNLSELRS